MLRVMMNEGNSDDIGYEKIEDRKTERQLSGYTWLRRYSENGSRMSELH